MSYYGKKWRIDGVVAGPIMRSTSANGQYTVLFERDFSSLEQIESINWAAPVIERLGAVESDVSLPVGYGFELADIYYESNVQTYRVVLKVGTQYLGDITGYQEQIAQLEETVATQNSTIEEQASEIQALTEAGSAEALAAELDAAYQEGVDSVE